MNPKCSFRLIGHVSCVQSIVHSTCVRIICLAYSSVRSRIHSIPYTLAIWRARTTNLKCVFVVWFLSLPLCLAYTLLFTMVTRLYLHFHCLFYLFPLSHFTNLYSVFLKEGERCKQQVPFSSIWPTKATKGMLTSMVGWHWCLLRTICPLLAH